MGSPARERIARIEALIHEDVGRNIATLCEAGRGGLFGAATALAEAPAPRVGLITGFFVPGGTPPAAETDGPPGAALLARGLMQAGVACRLATDAPCASACAAALTGAEAGAVPLDVVPLGSDPAAAIAAWRAAGVTHALSIERCGRGADGVPRNLRAIDISAHTALLDDLFLAGPWETLAIGDGGNEIGMGALPAALIANCVANGAAIACATPARHLVVAGVSHWGAYALLAALGVLRPDWRAAMLDALDPRRDTAALAAAVRLGPAVDGITRRQEPTIDTFAQEIHHQKLLAITEAATQNG